MGNGLYSNERLSGDQKDIMRDIFALYGSYGYGFTVEYSSNRPFIQKVYCKETGKTNPRDLDTRSRSIHHLSRPDDCIQEQLPPFLHFLEDTLRADAHHPLNMVVLANKDYHEALEEIRRKDRDFFRKLTHELASLNLIYLYENPQTKHKFYNREYYLEDIYEAYDFLTFEG